MSRPAPAVCLVTPGYVATTPRVVKEADALAAAGYRVRVVFTEGDLDRLRAFDAALLGGKPWRWVAVGWARTAARERSRFWRLTLRHQVARRLPARWLRSRALLASAEHRVYPALARAAAAEPADLFIGHYPAGLAAAAHAAERWGAALGFDAEDLHAAEPPETPEGRERRQRITWIERTLLPRCAHVSAASDGIADALAARYGIPRPVAVHNAFPAADRRPARHGDRVRRGAELSLYWFSQVIGLDRGLQDAIRAVGLLGGPVQLHLRGECGASTRAELFRVAAEARCGALHVHPLVPPDEIVASASEHDVGLALEQPINASRALSVTNKLFAYLAAGLAVAATDLPGQAGVLATCPGAGRLYTPGDHRTLAWHLEEWRRDPRCLRAAKTDARAAVAARWCWEIESRALVAAVDAVLRPRATACAASRPVRAGAP